jgi:hypothetical protein
MPGEHTVPAGTWTLREHSGTWRLSLGTAQEPGPAFSLVPWPPAMRWPSWGLWAVIRIRSSGAGPRLSPGGLLRGGTVSRGGVDAALCHLCIRSTQKSPKSWSRTRPRSVHGHKQEEITAHAFPVPPSTGIADVMADLRSMAATLSQVPVVSFSEPSGWCPGPSCPRPTAPWWPPPS